MQVRTMTVQRQKTSIASAKEDGMSVLKGRLSFSNLQTNQQSWKKGLWRQSSSGVLSTGNKLVDSATSLVPTSIPRPVAKGGVAALGGLILLGLVQQVLWWVSRQSSCICSYLRHQQICSYAPKNQAQSSTFYAKQCPLCQTKSSHDLIHMHPIPFLSVHFRCGHTHGPRRPRVLFLDEERRREGRLRIVALRWGTQRPAVRGSSNYVSQGWSV